MERLEDRTLLAVNISDSFNRVDPTHDAAADLAFGGAGAHYYVDIFNPPNPHQSATITSDHLQNFGLDFGGVQYSTDSTPNSSPSFSGENIGQDHNISAVLFVPRDASGDATEAGPYFRSRNAFPNDGIIGGTSAGYWVLLLSTGEVYVKNLNTVSGGFTAYTARPASFDPSATHTLEAAFSGTTLQVAVDGQLQTFLSVHQGNIQTTSVSIPATNGSNDGTAGVAFGAEANRGLAGGESADDLIVSDYSSLSGLPVSNNFTSALDYGDAPDATSGRGAGNYNTRGIDNGPSHVIVPGLKIGTTVTGENDAAQNSGATGDSGDDGISNPSTALSLVTGSAPSVSVNVTNTTGTAATLAGWIDYNGNGIFDNATERATVAVPDGFSGNVTLVFPTVPSGSAANTYARFRLSTDSAGQNPVGAASDGEVEDYAVTISAGTTTATLDGSNNLVISDSVSGGRADSLTIKSDTTNNRFVISDPGAVFSTSISGSGGSGTNSITIPFSSVSGTQIFVNTRAGNDSLTVDFSLGNFSKSISYDGGTQTTSDSLTLTGGSTFATITHTFTSASAGTIDITGNSQISYTGLEPITDNMDADNRVFTFTGGAETITVTDTGGADGMMTIDSTLSESVTFTNPTATLTINAGDGDDMMTITSVDAAYDAALTINGDTENDTVNLNADITFAAGNSLTVTAESIAIGVNTDLVTSGAGTVSLTGDNIVIDATATINVGANTVTLTTQTAGTLIDLGGADGAGTLGLTDAELDRITAGTLAIGDASSGAITVSAAITRAAATNFTLTTGAGIDFDGESLNADGGDVTLTTGATGGVTADAAGTDITADDLTINAGTGGIGSLADPLRTDVTTLVTDSNNATDSDQFLFEANSVTIGAGDLDAGTATITLAGGTFLTTATGSILSNTVVASGATLGGNGTVTGSVDVQSGGIVAPGASTGILNTGSVTFTASSTFNVEVNGNVAGTSYDQLNVTGTVTLGGATLNASGTIPSLTGQTIVLIKNDGSDAVSGTFAGLAEGDTVFINSIGFVISYVGGTGNDVTLTQLIQVTVTVSPASINEDAPGAMIYTFTRDGILDVMTVNFAVSGTATYGFNQDYTQTGAATFSTTAGTFVFGYAQSTATIYIDPVADSFQEPDETVTLTLKPGSNYVPAIPNTATGTIVNDDVVITPDITVSVSPSSVTEDGPANLDYTFTRTGNLNSPLTVNFDVSGSATFGTDYTQSGASSFGATGTVTFGSGQSTAVVTLDPQTDSVIEPDETATLTVAAGSGYTGTGNSATGTILNDDGSAASVTVAVSPGSVAEDGPTNLVYTFTRSNTSTEPLTINFLVGGTATLADLDYSQTGAATYSDTAGTVTFGFGQTTATVVIDPTADSRFEPDETVILTVTSGSGYNVGGANSATGTIANDDHQPVTPAVPDISVAVSPSSVAEDGSTNLVYTFTRSTGFSDALTVNFNVSGSAMLGSDYLESGANTLTATMGTVTFGFGQSTATVTVDPQADTTVESNETVILTLASGTGYNIGAPSTATGTILDDDTTSVVMLSVSPSSVAEDSGGNLLYTFTRSGNLSQTLTVSFTVGGDATYLDDYTATGANTFSASSGTITFGSNQSTASITVNPLTDTTVEPDETVVLTLSSNPSYTIGGGGVATGTILNDDATSGISVAVSPGSVMENSGSSLIYTFTRSGSVSEALTVNFTVGGDATYITDYTQSGAASFSDTSGSVTFGYGQMHAIVAITPRGDTQIEPDESVILTLTSGAGYDVGAPTTATGTIQNDDGNTPNVSVTVSPGSVSETGGQDLVFSFTRDNTNPDNLTVHFDVGGSADYLSDYTQTGASTFGPTSGTITFGYLQTTILVYLHPIDDGIAEGTEDVSLTVTSGTDYLVGSPSAALGTITDGAPPPSDLTQAIDTAFSSHLGNLLA